MSIFGSRKHLNANIINQIDPELVPLLKRRGQRFSEVDVQNLKDRTIAFFKAQLDYLDEIRVRINRMDHSSYSACDGHDGLNQLIDLFVGMVLEEDNLENEIRKLLRVPKKSAFRSSFLYPQSYGCSCETSFEDYYEPWQSYFQTFLEFACGLHKPMTRKEIINKLSAEYCDLLHAIYQESYQEIGHYPASDHPATGPEIVPVQQEFLDHVSWVEYLMFSGDAQADQIATIIYDEFISEKPAGRVQRFRQELQDPEGGDLGDIYHYIGIMVRDMSDELREADNEMAKMLLEEFGLNQE